MRWHHRIAIVLLTVLAGLPVAGTACMVVCGSSGGAATHHGSSGTCDESTHASNGPQIGGYSAHDCSTHDRTVRLAAATTETMAGPMASQAPVPAYTVPVVPFESRPLDAAASPSAVPPLSTPPLVLRV